MLNVARRIIISGRVQGVGFRAFVHGYAVKLGLDGFVRNRRDGTVEALVAGEINAVETLIAHCHEGPPASRVTQVLAHETEETADKGFKNLPTV